MKTLLLALHSFAVLAALSLCVWEGVQAIIHYGAEYRALTLARSVPAVLVGSYALAHIALLITRRVTTQALLWFYPLSFSLGLIAAFVSQSYGKGWAPADTTEAFYSSLIGFSIVGLLWLAAAFSCYQAFVLRSNQSA